MREPALEGVADEEVAVEAREGLDEEVAPPRQDRAAALPQEQLDELRRQPVPLERVGEEAADALGEEARERELAAGVGRDLGVGAGRGAGRQHLVLVDALEAQHLAGEKEGVADRHGLGEILLDLAEHAPAARHGPCRAFPAPRARAGP